ncbi:hypothetical protein EUTSA_v10000192mg [Eutrema salsugineum]|uniref:F-box domain-containing protein n=1 Tax=Eutrema salsugineum TaxID=72664 RepID=V4L7W3_EUTSA|nr:F-box/kelch-repeat protein At1g64840 [Eutrema salsugineum]ESQ46455.1 hypothetical protein EUTSA_v10000192mg [Eutrema salsugineum]
MTQFLTQSKAININMAEPSTKKNMTDWTQLPEELLQMIIEKLNNCFDVVNARSVCSSWRSLFPFPSCLLIQSYSLPTYPIEKQGLCSLEKIPLILFRVPTAVESVSEYFVGGICRDESGDYMEFPSPLQCTLRVKLARSDSALQLAGAGLMWKKILDCESTWMNTRGCQIINMGHQYQIVCWSPEGLRKSERDVAYLELSKKGVSEFLVLRSYSNTLVVFKSGERKWKRVENVPGYSSTGVVSFRGKFYAAFVGRDVFVINPRSLKATRLRRSLKHRDAKNYLVPIGDDELFLVEENVTPIDGTTFGVFRLDVKARKWVEVSDFGDRVFFVGCLVNVACSVKELPDGCGVSGNSILFTQLGLHISFYVYSSGCWRSSSESRVEIIVSGSPALAFSVRVK